MSRSSAPLASLLALALVLPASTARADDEKEKAPETAPASSVDSAAKTELHYPPPSTRFKLIAGGLLLSGAAWGISYAAARAWPENPSCVYNVIYGTGTVVHSSPLVFCTAGPPGSSQLGIPIVGPWMALGRLGCATDELSPCSTAKLGVRAAAWIVDGIVQAAGLTLIAEAIVMKTESPVDADSKKAAFTLRYRGVEMTPAPLVSGTMAGMGLSGTF